MTGSINNLTEMNDIISKSSEIAQKSRERVANERGKETVYENYDFQEALNIGYYAAKEMAEVKDNAIKQFLIEHIFPDITIETNEDGEPLAESFVDASMKRFELAAQAFEAYKEFEKRLL